jgi:hypothetical protein
MKEKTYSKNGVPIRLPQERWFHITEEHSELAGYFYDVLLTISDPDEVLQGYKDELLGIKKITSDKYLVVIYKEIDRTDGFVITAFLTKRLKQLQKRVKVWPK